MIPIRTCYTDHKLLLLYQCRKIKITLTAVGRMIDWNAFPAAFLADPGIDLSVVRRRQYKIHSFRDLTRLIDTLQNNCLICVLCLQRADLLADLRCNYRY